MTARAIFLAFLLSASGAHLAACAGGAANSPASEADDDDSDREEEDDKPRRGRVKSKDDVSEKGKSWGGWRWKGKRNDCFFKSDNQCFDSKKKACKAAGCSTSVCKTDDGAPAQVSCPGKKKKKSDD